MQKIFAIQRFWGISKMILIILVQINRKILAKMNIIKNFLTQAVSLELIILIIIKETKKKNIKMKWIINWELIKAMSPI